MQIQHITQNDHTLHTLGNGRALKQIPGRFELTRAVTATGNGKDSEAFNAQCRYISAARASSFDINIEQNRHGDRRYNETHHQLIQLYIIRQTESEQSVRDSHRTQPYHRLSHSSRVLYCTAIVCTRARSHRRSYKQRLMLLRKTKKPSLSNPSPLYTQTPRAQLPYWPVFASRARQCV